METLINHLLRVGKVEENGKNSNSPTADTQAVVGGELEGGFFPFSQFRALSDSAITDLYCT